MRRLLMPLALLTLSGCGRSITGVEATLDNIAKYCVAVDSVSFGPASATTYACSVRFLPTGAGR